MSEYPDISELDGRPRWQIVAFAVGCAERIAPMAVSLGGPSIAQAAEAGLALAWNAAQGRVQPEAEQVISDLLGVIERASGDERRPEALAAHALDVTVFALEAASGPTPTDRARAAGNGVLDLAGDVDFTLTHMPSDTAVILESEDEELHGPLVTREIEAQRTSIRLLDVGDPPNAEAIEGIRRLSKAQASELARVMPQYAQRRFQKSP